MNLKTNLIISKIKKTYFKQIKNVLNKLNRKKKEYVLN